MLPEVIAGGAAVLGALISAGPAYLAARRSGKTAASEGSATREQLAALAERLDADREVSARDRAETREELRAIRREVREVAAWQVQHAAEHAAHGWPRA